MRQGHVAHPTIALTLEQDYVPSRPSPKKQAATSSAEKPVEKPVEKPAPPAPTQEPDLAERLRRLDAVYEAEFARLGKKHANGIESLTYKR